jgi:peptidoglycan/LPS O-acetylase OafA/YrhL
MHSRVATPRYEYLDGLRGWASLYVLLFHFVGEIFIKIYPAMQSPVWSPFSNGSLAVFVFFILSGDALSSVFFSRNQSTDGVDRLVVKRYFRLSLPIFLSCFLVWAVVRLGLDFHSEAAKVIHREEWLGTFLQIDTSVFRLIKYSAIDVYTAHTSEKSFNPMLWTMSVEMAGSMLVFLTCYVWKRLRQPVVAVLIGSMSLLCLGSMYSLFLVGMLFAHYRSTGVLDHFASHPLATYLGLPLAVACFVGSALVNRYWHVLPVHLFIAVIFAASIYLNLPIRSALSKPFSKYLGSISFPLYLTHFSVLISILSFGVITSKPSDQAVDLQQLANWVALSLAMAFVVAHLFREIETYFLRHLDRWVNSALA